MSIMYFTADGVSGELSIDTQAIDVTLPGVERNYTAINFANDSSYITGTGSFSSRTITFSAKFSKSGGYNTAFNTLRTAFMQWLALPKYKYIYFNIVDNDGNTYRQRVYPIIQDGERYSNYGISSNFSVSFQMAAGYFQALTGTSSNYTITGSQVNVISVTNSGVLSTPPQFQFTPTTAMSSFQIQLAEGYGFTLTSSFLSGQLITYDCSTGQVTVNGAVVNGIQTSGSLFNLPPGTNFLYVYATDGTLTVSYTKRII